MMGKERKSGESRWVSPVGRYAVMCSHISCKGVLNDSVPMDIKVSCVDSRKWARKPGAEVQGMKGKG